MVVTGGACEKVRDVESVIMLCGNNGVLLFLTTVLLPEAVLKIVREKIKKCKLINETKKIIL